MTSVLANATVYPLYNCINIVIWYLQIGTGHTKFFIAGFFFFFLMKSRSWYYLFADPSHLESSFPIHKINETEDNELLECRGEIYHRVHNIFQVYFQIPIDINTNKVTANISSLSK